jgi:thioredoxin reductase (NADPH)
VPQDESVGSGKPLSGAGSRPPSGRAEGIRFAEGATVPRNKPVILLVEPREDRRAAGEEFLRSDCSLNFEVSSVADADSAIPVLENAAAGRMPAAMMLVHVNADEDLPRAVLARAKELFSGLRTVVYGAPEPRLATEAKRSGLVDYVLEELWDAPEVILEPVLRDVLRAWEGGGAGIDVVRVFGDQWQPRCHDVKDLLARHRVPYQWVDTEPDDQDAAGQEGVRIVFPDGEELVDPDDASLAQKLGFATAAESRLYDLVIVGGGPAGLAAAVYASSEGLRTVVVERDVPGGQAGSSALIENYLGFPEGISGAELASRAVTQAKKFGAEILVTRSAVGLRDDRGYRIVKLDDGSEIVSHAVLLAMGVAYRRFTAAGAERLTGSGVYYGAAAAEAARFRGGDVCLLGSGNSAAQAALLLARYVKRLTIITIDPTLEATMSKYLVDRIGALPNVRLMTGTTVTEVQGAERVESIVVEKQEGGDRRVLYTDALFVWIGATPHTDWLADSVARDRQGFVLTGRALRREALRGWPEDAWPSTFESSMRGVFVAGDVRHGSAKRLGSAVGEGAMAVHLVHEYLKER